MVDHRVMKISKYLNIFTTGRFTGQSRISKPLFSNIVSSR